MLKDALEQNGYTFRSSTDSEVLVNLIEYVRATSGCSLPEAVRQALRQVDVYKRQLSPLRRTC